VKQDHTLPTSSSEHVLATRGLWERVGREVEQSARDCRVLARTDSTDSGNKSDESEVAK
jgi:hypothetical protein